MEISLSRRLKALAAIAVTGAFVLTLHTSVVQNKAALVSADFPECADGIDNDNDGNTDYPQDSKCASLQDASEGSNGGLFVSVTDGKNEIHPRGSLTYIISLNTERPEGMQSDIFFQMPHQTNLLGASDNGARNGALIVWRDVSVFPSKPRKLTVTVEVDPDAKDGLLLAAEVASEGQKVSDTTRVVQEDDAVIASRPQLKVSVSDNKKYAQPGETLEYLVSVRNPTQQERSFDLRFQIPTETRVEYVSGINRTDRKAVAWDNQTVGPLGAREYKVTLRIDHDAEEFYTIRTRASVGPVSSTDTTTVHTGVLPNAIIVTANDGLDTVVPGALVTYDIALENRTNQLATELDINNALPSYLEFVDASEGGYWNGKNVRWQGLTVAPNGYRSLRVTGRVRSDAPLGQRLRNTVAVNGYESVDITEIGSHVSGQGLAQAQQVLVRKHADRGEVRPGETVTYTVSVQNTTSSTLTHVKVEDRMDSPYIRVTNANSGTTDRNRITWNIDTLAPGQTWSVNYTAQIDYSAPHGVSIPNIVTVSGNGMDTVSLSERIHTSHIGVISNLPPTGAAFDALFLGLTGLAGAAQTMAQRRKLLKRV